MSRIDTLLTETGKELCEASDKTKAICNDRCSCCPLDILPEIETNSGVDETSSS